MTFQQCHVYLHEQYKCMKPIFCSYYCTSLNGFKDFIMNFFRIYCNQITFQIITYVSYFAVIPTLTKDAFSTVKITFRFFMIFNTFAQVFWRSKKFTIIGYYCTSLNSFKDFIINFFRIYCNQITFQIITYVSYFAVIPTLTKDAFSTVKIIFRFFMIFNTFAQLF